MNQQTRFHRGIIAAAILAVGILACRGTAKAGIHLESSVSSFNDGANLAYDTGPGLYGSSQSGAGGYAIDPDGLPGRLACTVYTGISNSPTFSRASANLPSGLLRAIATAGLHDGISSTAGNRAELRDTITFHNATGQAAVVTISWKVHGSIAVGGPTEGFRRAGYNAAFRSDFPGHILQFSGRGQIQNDSADATSADATASGWDSSTVEPLSGGFGGANFAGTFTIPAGDFSIEFSARIESYAQGDQFPASSDFSNTASLGISVPQGVSFTSAEGTLSAQSRLANISTRARVGGGDNVSIAGFIVTGNVPKKVIIRGIGPSLATFFPNFLPNPTLQLNQGNSVLTTNDNWTDTQQSEIQNSGFAPTSDLESAIIRILDPGSYTAVLRDKNNAPGIGVVQVYDLDTAADSKLANISTRAFIEPGDNVLFAGIIGGGNGSQPKVLINARGPSLAPFGVSNPIPDPILELHDKNGALLTSNNDWQSDQKDAIAATGVGPSDPKESALLATLLPGEGYTAVVKDANGASGVALVEVYQLQ